MIIDEYNNYDKLTVIIFQIYRMIRNNAFK